MRTEGWKSALWKSGAVFGLAVAAAASGCKSSQTANAPAPIIDANGGPDPAAVNNAPVSDGATGATGSAVSGTARAPGGVRQQPARVLDQQAYAPPASASGEQYPEQTGSSSPAQQSQYPAGENGPAYDQQAYDQQVDAGQDALYASEPPPPLPTYQQPELTDPGDQWTPGYWNYASQGYFWVPGAWVAPPFIGALWTPGYWGASGGRYRFHHGYWGRHIGFYGGVPYGFGYTGQGYEGGYWNGNRFFYNNAVNRVNLNTVHNVYARNVTAVHNDRVSYNGPGGWKARPTASDEAVLHEQRVAPMQVQRTRVQEAASNRQQFAADNHGHPAVAVLGQRQPADQMAPTMIQAVGRPQFAGEQQPGRAGGFDREDARGGRAEQGRQGDLPQGRRTQPEQQRPVPVQPRPIQSEVPAQEQHRFEPQRQEPGRQTQTPSAPARAQPAPRSEAQPEVVPRPQFQTQPVTRPQFQPQPEPRSHVQPETPQRLQAQPPRPQRQPSPRPQPAPPAPAAPHVPQARPSESTHPHS